MSDGRPSDSADDPEALARAAARATRELETPGDPEIGPPVPASALAANAISPSIDRGKEIVGGSSREILRLAWPVVASQVLLNLTGLIDRMMIGRLAEDGSAAIPLAAVGYATQLFHLVHSTLFAVGLACVALMARAIGARNPETAR